MRNVRTQPTPYRGVRFASKGEAAMAATLDQLTLSRIVLWWCPAPKVYLGSASASYRPDFLVEFGSDLGGSPQFGDVVLAGDLVMIDFKGRVPRAKDRGDVLFRRNVKAWRMHGPCPLVITTRGRGGGIHWHERIEGPDLDQTPQSGAGGTLEAR